MWLSTALALGCIAYWCFQVWYWESQNTEWREREAEARVAPQWVRVYMMLWVAVPLLPMAYCHANFLWDPRVARHLNALIHAQVEHEGERGTAGALKRGLQTR